MRIAILHYHFDRGGVTRVVSSTLDAFRTRFDHQFALLSGRPVDGIDAPSDFIPGLDYSTTANQTPSADELYETICQSARTLFAGHLPDVWHIHNPALGKNTAMVGLVHRLAASGQALLLHEHDFAEDFRPANFQLREAARQLNESPFPHSERVRFATLNARDRRILLSAGMPTDHVFSLANPIPSSDFISAEKDSDLFLYPVRALARKNFGEFLLLAYAGGNQFHWKTTLPPTNAAYQRQFERWKDIGAKLSLPVSLGVAEEDDLSFEERIGSCRAVVSTSVAEGFGLSFLEPWTFGRPVVGRNLPEITSEFVESGVPLESLYDRLPVPTEAVDVKKVASKWRQGVESAYSSFGVASTSEEVSQIEEEIRNSSDIDFALLGESLQEDALVTIKKKNIPFSLPFSGEFPSDTEIESARATILKNFSLSSYADKLEMIYKLVAESPSGPIDSIDTDKVLSGFLHPSRFRPHFVE
ncbi:MAG: hypothetical protein AAGJ81_02515 [Verrucomicrobiota bacterium]